jgi:cell division septum initiation protein DivIVA
LSIKGTPERGGIHINVLRIIDEIEQLVENGKNFLGKRVIPEEEFFTKIQQLRSALPKSMKEAEDLMRKAEAIVKSAQTEADRLIDTAEREAEKAINDARSRADRTINESKTHADRILSDAQNRSERMISDAEAKANRTIEDANALSQRTIDEANLRAENIEKDAKISADEMVAENSITIRAQEEAEQKINEATNEAETLRRNADDYAFEVLDKVSGVLDKLGVSIEAGKDALRRNSSAVTNEAYDSSYAAYGNSEYNNGFRN